MKNMVRSKRYIIGIISILCAVLCMLGSFSLMHTAQADEQPVNLGVLEDFADTDFDIGQYPLVEDDYSLKVVQIAESTDKELIVYVYQPFGDISDLRAKQIRLSTGINDNISYRDYSLEYLATEGSIGKYKVKDFTLLSDNLRYYAIACIFRKWQEFIDKPSDTDNTVTYVSFDVSQLWTASTVNGDVSYSLTELDTIEIKTHRAGYCVFEDLHALGNYTVTEDYYIAFSTEIKMDRVLEADVSYTVKTLVSDPFDYPFVYDWLPYTVTVYSDQQRTAKDGYWFWTGVDNYTWQDIESTESFVNRVPLSDEANKDIKAMDWVVHFLHRNVTANEQTNKYAGPLTIGDTTILRLKYTVDGKTYNVGVVDNKTNMPDNPDNVHDDPMDWFKEVIKWIKEHWQWLVAGVVIVIVLIIFAPFIPSLLSLIVQLLMWVVKGIVWVVLLPFKLIIGLFTGGDKT